MEISNTGYWSGQDVPENHTTSPALARWIADFLRFEKEQNISDLGCGVGGYLLHLHQNGFKYLTGYEGSPIVEDRFTIKKQDLTKPFTVLNKGHTLFLECAEHVPSQYEHILLQNIANVTAPDCYLIASWAVRGQPGHGHVNCRNNDEAIDVIQEAGFKFLEVQTQAARRAMKDDPLWWFKNTLLVFERV